MTPSQYVKSQGLPSLAYVAREAGVPQRTMFDWYKKRIRLFEIVVDGVWLHYAETTKEPTIDITEEDKRFILDFNKRHGRC